ncbi:uncharacterized protein BDZ99DRAFT_524871 [Mytilinidion resinicola]|uniref:Uncharacterized protein n=1 Tax=Mytilinidion resinicola TaxID=574789 RepID=A0A6A6YBE9_9PEZI|nr:uncharacterized protein BDZ99DRAFT_524871 [Mytilinidion resinicola]KAF2805157.1 hypothetical protein BDZ99DRAFT_524871 [Mytilinidion resinicola]
MAYYRSSTTKLERPVQVLNDAYIDTKRLIEMMDGLFPSGDYKARHKDNRWMIQAPRPLTDDEIESIYQDSSSI